MYSIYPYFELKYEDGRTEEIRENIIKRDELQRKSGFYEYSPITIEIDVPCPPRPTCFAIGERIKAAGVHVLYAEAGREIEEIPVKALAAVGQPGGGGQPCARSDHDDIFSHLYSSSIYMYDVKIKRLLRDTVP